MNHIEPEHPESLGNQVQALSGMGPLPQETGWDRSEARRSLGEFLYPIEFRFHT